MNEWSRHTFWLRNKRVLDLFLCDFISRFRDGPCYLHCREQESTTELAACVHSHHPRQENCLHCQRRVNAQGGDQKIGNKETDRSTKATGGEVSGMNQ